MSMQFFHTPDKAEDRFLPCKKKKHVTLAKMLGKLIRVWIDTNYAGMGLEEFIVASMGTSKRKMDWKL